MDELRLSSLIEARNELEDAINDNAGSDRDTFFMEEELKEIDAEISRIVNAWIVNA